MKEETMMYTVKIKKTWLTAVLLFLLTSPLAWNAEAAVTPQGTITVAVTTLAEEGFLPDRNSTSSGPLWECVYSHLIYTPHLPNGKFMPGVAEKWEYSKDYRTLTFKLRKGIQFQDGWGELTADDVKWTIQFITRPASTSIVSSEMKSNITSIETPDRYTVVLKLKDADPGLWLRFSSSDMAVPILCKKYVETVGEEKANRNPVGSGPYRLVEQRIGDYAKFEALNNHWLVVPEFKYLVLKVVPEVSTRIAMLKTGEVDVALELGVDQLQEVEKAKLKAIVSKNANMNFIPFGGMLTKKDKRYVEGYHQQDPWKDIRVREAMNIAIDRTSLAKNVFQGLATPSAIWVALPGWDKLKPIPYDPKRAKQLLAEAGYANGFSFKIAVNMKDPVNPLIAEAVASYWAAIGLKAEINPIEYATWRTTNKSGKTAGWVWTHMMSNFADFSSVLTGYELENSSTPFWQSEETTMVIEKILKETDPKKRDMAYQELSRLYRSIYSHIPIAYSSKLHAAGKTVGEWFPGCYLHPKNIIFARHAKPLNTYRLFTP